ncbi:MAG: sulfurtransferase [Ardenticatenales bacterium]|jgi:thiosulfate/3-mercaptopyruvate sulfurtransferase|nr:sulfurtransferase [Ardenticatenales bacterium]
MTPTPSALPWTVLVDVRALAARLDADGTELAVVDCRHRLADPAWGATAYRESHVPDAVFADLDRDLSAPVVPGVTGRHPLPSPDALAATLGGWGIDAATQVVAYDDIGGAFAARLWWLLKWLGHDAVAVVDGGWPAWLAAGLPVRSGVEHRAARTFAPRPRPAMVADADTTAAAAAGGTVRVLDARAADRFAGQNETIDPVAGHIPGAVSLPFAGGLGPDGRLLSPAVLASRFDGALAGADAAEAIVYCGSGVTAAHLVLAAAHAGRPLPRLYAGSWSEWIVDPARGVATGA